MGRVPNSHRPPVPYHIFKIAYDERKRVAEENERAIRESVGCLRIEFKSKKRINLYAELGILIPPVPTIDGKR